MWWCLLSALVHGSQVELFQRSLIFTGPVLREEWFIVTSDRSGKFWFDLGEDGSLVSDWRARLNYPVERDLPIYREGERWLVEYPTDQAQVTLVLNFAFHDRVRSFPKEATMHESQKVQLTANEVSITAKEYSLALLVPQQAKVLSLQCGVKDVSKQQPTTQANDPTIPKGIARYTCDSPHLQAHVEMASKIPMMRIRSLKRTLHLSPWTGWLSVTDDYEWQHEGHAVSEFSRAEFMKLLMQPSLGRVSQAMNILPVLIPAKAVLLRLYDEVGLLLNQQLNRRAISDHYHAIDVQPRFPLAAKGWNTRFVVYYQHPAIHEMNLLSLPFDIAVDEMQISIASDSLPIKMAAPSRCKETDGKMICSNLTMESAQQTVRLSHDRSFMGRLRAMTARTSPLLIAVMTAILLFKLVFWIRDDPRLFKRNRFIKLIAQRHRLIAKKANVRHLESQIMSLFFSKGSASPSMQAINLRKIYDEQTSLLHGEADAGEIEAMRKRVEQTEQRLIPTL